MEFIKDKFVQAEFTRFSGGTFYDGGYWDRRLDFRLEDGGLLSVFDCNFVGNELHVGLEYDLLLDMFLPKFVGPDANAINNMIAKYLWNAVQISKAESAEAQKVIKSGSPTRRFGIGPNHVMLATSAGLVLMDTQDVWWSYLSRQSWALY